MRIASSYAINSVFFPQGKNLLKKNLNDDEQKCLILNKHFILMPFNAPLGIILCFGINLCRR